jgi:hypothetical protein
MYKIYQNYGPVYTKRNNQVIEIKRNDEIAETELATVFSDCDVEFVDETTKTVIKFNANTMQLTTIQAALITENTPATDAGVVLEPVETPSKNTKA